MNDTRYMISEASKQIDVEPHVLRNWEQELLLEIPRNEMGHRYFRESDITLLKTVKNFKEQGFQLKAIKMLLPNLHKFDSIDADTMIKLKDKLNEKVTEMEMKETYMEGTSMETGMLPASVHEVEVNNAEKMEAFKALMQNLITDVVNANNDTISDKVSDQVSTNVLKEMKEAFRRQEEKTEERYRRFDTLIRETQKSRSYAAVTYEPFRKKKKSKFFKKNKVYL